MIAIDGYDDVALIGQGGLGDVYRARRTSTGATVAIKVLRDVSDESLAWHRTRRELTALVALAGHANVVQLLEVLDLPEGPALVMEYAPGGSVASMMLRRDEPLSVGETVLVGRQVAAALTAAHRLDIVHRDVKPQNLLIDAYGQVKLCDFGIASVARSDEFQVRTSAISMRYASPEDLEEDVHVGPASDVYSLGATLLHMAHGAPPTLKERLSPWVPPTTADPALAALDEVVARCLQPDPALRPTSADLVDELERLGWAMDERSRSPRPEARTFASAGDDRTSPRPAPEPEGGPVAAGAAVVGGRSRRGRLIAVAAAVLGVVAVSASVVGRDADRAVVALADRPPDLAPLDDLDWPLAAPGACFVQQGDRLDEVDCARPHDLQQVGGGELDDSEADRDAMRRVAAQSCAAQFAEYAGATADELGLAAPFVVPSVATWSQGDRSYGCFAAMPGHRIVGDLAGIA